MNYSIYGIRLIGEREVRYIGQTSLSLKERNRSHFNRVAVSKFNRSPLCEWLHSNKDQIEFVLLGFASSVREARQRERDAILFCLALNHRLFNRVHVPTSLRLVEAA